MPNEKVIYIVPVQDNLELTDSAEKKRVKCKRCRLRMPEEELVDHIRAHEL